MGWKNESQNHSLASRGVKSKGLLKMKKKKGKAIGKETDAHLQKAKPVITKSLKGKKMGTSLKGSGKDIKKASKKSMGTGSLFNQGKQTGSLLDKDKQRGSLIKKDDSTLKDFKATTRKILKRKTSRKRPRKLQPLRKQKGSLLK